MTPVTIGTRVRTCLYNRGLGTVFAIHGDQAPATVGSVCGVIRTGGRASSDIVFDQGSKSMQLPETILHGVQWEILDEVVDSDAIATALARVNEREAKQRSEKDDAEARFAAEVDRLRADEALVGLVQGVDTGRQAGREEHSHPAAQRLPWHQVQRAGQRARRHRHRVDR